VIDGLAESKGIDAQPSLVLPIRRHNGVRACPDSTYLFFLNASLSDCNGKHRFQSVVKLIKNCSKKLRQAIAKDPKDAAYFTYQPRTARGAANAASDRRAGAANGF
jgi:hypothetical protein